MKGRFNEEVVGIVGDAERLNEEARELYRKEVQGLVKLLNKEIGEGKPKLYVPDLRFNRDIGEYQGRRFSVKGELLDEEAYSRHLEAVLPSITDREKLRKIMKEPNWIAPAV